MSIAGETRTNIVITEAERERYIKVNEAGPTLKHDELDALLVLIRQRIKPGDLCALCGSLPPGAPENFYADLITMIQNSGARARGQRSGLLGRALRLCPRGGMESHPSGEGASR